MPSSLINNKIPIEPFLRWAGGKCRLVNNLVYYLPKDITRREYIEPFVGAGSLFFKLQPKKALISDSNQHLINTYKYIRKNPDLIHVYLSQHSKNSSENYYYKIRTKYNCSKPSAAQAARFIYLNRTCFNGIFRVNQKGEFNVPYGWKYPPILPSLDYLRHLGKILKRVRIRSYDYQKALKKASANDFVYLDPPYPPLNGTANFTHYTKDRFLEYDQIQLADLFAELHKRKCKLMMSNADIPLIRRLYEKYHINELSVVRYITCKHKKHSVSELVITNYKSFISS